MLKPFSQACANNSQPIAEQLSRLLATAESVFEIGSGTGQHAAYFAQALPHLIWHTSDLRINHEGIDAWVTEAKLSNLMPPLEFDVTSEQKPVQRYGAVFMANTLHIMDPKTVEACIEQSAQLLEASGLLVVYGPFNYDGQFTSDSNARFDQWLKATNPEQGIRDLEWIDKLAADQGLVMVEDIAMPANNRLITWRN